MGATILDRGSHVCQLPRQKVSELSIVNQSTQTNTSFRWRKTTWRGCNEEGMMTQTGHSVLNNAAFHI